MTGQQRAWRLGKTFISAVRPLALYLFMPGLCALAGIALRRPDMTTDEFFASSGNFYTAAGMTAAMYLLYRRCRAENRSFFDETMCYPERIRFKMAAGSLAFGGAASLAVSAVLTLFPMPAFIKARYGQLSGGIFGGTDLCFLLFTLLCLAPVLEEFIFRGMMLRRLLPEFGERAALYLSAAMFGLCHADILWSLYSFGMGIGLGKLTLREHNTAYAILVHAGFNLPSVVFYFLGKRGGWHNILSGSPILIAVYGLIGGAGMILLLRVYGEAAEK